MSQPKFASVTSALLARKGEAGPSADRQMLAERWQQVPSTQVTPTQVTMPSPPPPAPPRATAPVAAPVASTLNAVEPTVKIAIRLSEGQHFRMRVAAAQLQVTRQALMSAALDHYLATVCAAGVPECRCLRAASKSCDCSGC